MDFHLKIEKNTFDISLFSLFRTGKTDTTDDENTHNTLSG